MVFPAAGVTVGEGCGWIRVFTTPSKSSASTLVYLNIQTTVSEVAKDLILPPESTIWIQYGGGDSRCLLENENPLKIQEDFLTCLGYSHPSRRTRLAIQHDISYLITFHIGPKTRDCGGHGGLVDVHKNLVVPFWKKRYIYILGSTLFFYLPEERTRAGGCMDQVELFGARIEEVLGSKSGKQVLRVTSTKEIILGFEEPFHRDIWYKWILKGSEKDGSELLDLSGTGLVGLPQELVEWRPGVQELELGSNLLSPQSLEPLAALSSLKRLGLAANKLPALPESLLSSLSHLISLDLSDNKLQELPAHIAHLPCLEILKLDRNLLELVPNGPYAKLKSLSVSNNRLLEVPSFITYTSHMRALTLLETGDDSDKEKNNEEVIRPEDLTSVNLRSNLLKGSIILGNYGNLTQLDVSENSIENLDLSALSKLQTVQCSKNKLQQVTLNGSSLTSLIAGNNNLRKLIINPNPTKLKHLDISYNWLEKLPEWLSSCHHLRTLFASHNRLASLPDHLFCSELSSLQILQLSFNKLTSLPQVIRHIPLQQLFLQSNQIGALPQHFFLASSRMRVLNVSKNWLEELPSAVGDGHQLERLYLTANRLKNISCLTRFNNLRVLHIAYNTVTQLPDNCVTRWPDLEELVLSGNRISTLPSNIVQWQHLRVLRLHCNILSTCPSLSTSTSLKVLDLSHNQLDKIIFGSLIPKQLQSLDLSGNVRLHVDPSQFQQYKSQRKVSLVDVSGQNRNTLPCLPKRDEFNNEESGSNYWTLGFSETCGNRERLCISQLRLTNFCQSEALLGLFDGCNNSELPDVLVAATPRILMEERTVKETAADYMKFTLLSAHRELKEKGQRLGVCAMVCHIVRDRNHPTKCVLRIASVGEAKAVLKRAEGIVTLAHVPTQPMRSQLGGSSLFPLVVPDPHVTELSLRDTDEFLIIANKRLWEVLSPEEATSEVQDIEEPVLAAKRLQDLAQSYGCEDNLSIMVLRVHPTRQQQLIRELSYTLHKSSEGSWCDPTEDRSSPSGQSDATNASKHLSRFNHYRHYTDDKNELMVADCHNFQSVLMRENGIRKMSSKLSHLEDHMADCEESSSDSKSMGGQMSEEQFRCWEYMLEKNTQLLFDKELDTLSRGFTRRSVPARTPGLWGRSRSNPHLSPGSSVTTEPILLSRQFGSARSFQGMGRLGGSRRSINSGPNAAYFGSLQRLLPYHPVEYDFTAIKERNEQLDSLDQQEQDRMTRYWEVATTEL